MAESVVSENSVPVTTSPPRIELESSWLNELSAVFATDAMNSLRQFLKSELSAGKKVFPAKENWFRAFALTPFHSVRVVILGQDPYHGAGQAHGLSFSVPEGTPFPPSLRNIIRELESDLGVKWQGSGDLTEWAKQGVFLLNSVLTVREGEAASHQGKGWEYFTDQVIQRLNDRRENLVFVLWGAFAQKKKILIDSSRHCVIESVHPSPLSAHRGFFGSRPFSKANQYLSEKGFEPVQWAFFEHRES